MHRLLLLVALVGLSHLVSAGCLGDNDAQCCSSGGALYCDSGEGCAAFDRSVGWCRMPPGTGLCWRGRINICESTDSIAAAGPLVDATRAPPLPPTAAKVEEYRRTLDLHGDGSTRPATMFFKPESNEQACVGTQFAQVGAAKIRTGCPNIIQDLGLQLDDVVFGGYVAVHQDEAAVQQKLVQMGFKEAVKE